KRNTGSNSNSPARTSPSRLESPRKRTIHDLASAHNDAKRRQRHSPAEWAELRSSDPVEKTGCWLRVSRIGGTLEGSVRNRQMSLVTVKSRLVCVPRIVVGAVAFLERKAWRSRDRRPGADRHGQLVERGGHRPGG